jgi:hypothetical protein
MYLICLYLVILLIVLFFIFLNKDTSERFNTNANTNSIDESQNVTTSTINYEDMDTIDFSELKNSEKFGRDEKSIKLNNCISNYVNRSVKTFRDVDELMAEKSEDCDNIYDYTRVGGKYFNQMGYW